MTYVIKPPAKTTVTDTSLYDNFWFQRYFVTEYLGETGITRFDEDLFQNNDEEAELAVSDHRPIWTKFQINYSDDD